MKKVLAVLALTMLGVATSVGTTHADPVGALIPECGVFVYTPYTVPVAAHCNEYKAPTGDVLLQETFVQYP